MCDNFLTIKMVIFLIQNSDIFVQKQLFLFQLKNYEDRKLQLGEERTVESPPTKYMLYSDYHFLLFLKLPSLH